MTLPYGAAARLAVAGLSSQDAEMMRAAYLAMGLTAWFVIVPLSFASLVTGLVQALGTKWGLFRRYWVLVKFLIAIFATIVLLIHTQPGRRSGRDDIVRWRSRRAEGPIPCAPRRCRPAAVTRGHDAGGV